MCYIDTIYVHATYAYRFLARLTQIAGPRSVCPLALLACLPVCDVISEKRNDTKVRIDFAMSPRGEGTAEGG